MSIYIHELLCIDNAGAASVAHLSIADDEGNLTSQEADAVYTLDGQVLTTPIVTVGTFDLTLRNGDTRFAFAMRFEADGNSYYMLNPDTPADNVTAAGPFASNGVVGGISYTGYGATEEEVFRPYQAKAFQEYYSGTGDLQFSEVNTITVYDDDKFLELTTETGDLALAHVGYQGQEGPFSNTSGFPMTGLGDTSVRLVQVNFTGSTGPASFEAIAYSLERFGSTIVSYIPRAGAVNLADVASIDSVTDLPGSLDGVDYADFGLSFDPTTVEGSNTADILSGTWVNDEFIGKGGKDVLIGGVGKDKLFGGLGNDEMYGGMHADTLQGGKGADLMFGRSYDDKLLGQNAQDTLYGGWGDDKLYGGNGTDQLRGDQGSDEIYGGNHADTLFGGAGDDTLKGDKGDDDLRGGTGDDRLTDGDGADTVTGNGGSDTFVMIIDGDTDVITDFTDGVDFIDLAAIYKNLIITDVAPGEVHIQHSGEVLIVFDTAGTLTAADLTKADFL